MPRRCSSPSCSSPRGPTVLTTNQSAKVEGDKRRMAGALATAPDTSSAVRCSRCHCGHGYWRSTCLLNAGIAVWCVLAVSGCASLTHHRSVVQPGQVPLEALLNDADRVVDVRRYGDPPLSVDLDDVSTRHCDSGASRSGPGCPGGSRWRPAEDISSMSSARRPLSCGATGWSIGRGAYATRATAEGGRGT
jgi:hypothetical protein